MDFWGRYFAELKFEATHFPMERLSADNFSIKAFQPTEIARRAAGFSIFDVVD